MSNVENVRIKLDLTQNNLCPAHLAMLPAEPDVKTNSICFNVRLFLLRRVKHKDIQI